MSEKFLVIGANGQHGSTGAHLTDRLLERGEAVRIFVRRETDATRGYAAHGAEGVVGDLLDQRTIRPALDGVTQGYFTFPADLTIVRAAANWAEAVRGTGNSVRTVMMSMHPAQPGNNSPFGRASWLAEQVMSWAGIDLQIVKILAMFHENIEMEHGETIPRGVMRNSFGTGAAMWISSADAADLILEALLDPEKFKQPLAEVNGTEIFTHPQIAEMLTQITGHPVTYEDIDLDTWAAEMRTFHHPALTPTMIDHLCGFASQKAAVAPRLGDTGDFTRLTGRAPRTLSTYLQRFAV